MRLEHLETLLKPSEENKASLEHFLTYSLLSFTRRGVCSTTGVSRICVPFRHEFWRENEKMTLQEDVNQGWPTPAQSPRQQNGSDRPMVAAVGAQLLNCVRFFANP